MNREITIGIGDEQETAQEFIEVWRRTERREAPTAPEEYLYFPDLETLLGMLTPRRLAIRSEKEETTVYTTATTQP
jgi:hypothetical protein